MTKFSSLKKEINKIIRDNRPSSVNIALDNYADLKKLVLNEYQTIFNEFETIDDWKVAAVLFDLKIVCNNTTNGMMNTVIKSLYGSGASFPTVISSINNDNQALSRIVEARKFAIVRSTWGINVDTPVDEERRTLLKRLGYHLKRVNDLCDIIGAGQYFDKISV